MRRMRSSGGWRYCAGSCDECDGWESALSLTEESWLVRSTSDCEVELAMRATASEGDAERFPKCSPNEVLSDRISLGGDFPLYESANDLFLESFGNGEEMPDVGGLET